jgi:uncharacterized cofD-like protein
VRGTVLPAANQKIVLKAKMTDGTIVTGESRIPHTGKKIDQVFIEPANVAPLDEALEALYAAECILIGPGSLYTSILPNLLVPGIAKAIYDSPAKVKAYICNIMTQPGETDNYKVSDHIVQLYRHVGADLFDYVIVNDGKIPDYIKERYAEKGAQPVLLDREKLACYPFEIVTDHLVTYETFLRHDAERLSRTILRLLAANYE